MNQLHFTTIQQQKWKQLTKDERVLIQIRLKDGWSKRAIARELGCLHRLSVMKLSVVL